jgi:hypothetical protein
VPLIIGSGLTVTTAVAIQPFALVKVIVAVPAAFPVTTPVALTEAIAVAEEVQGFTAAGVAVLDNVVVKPAQTVSVPVIAGSAVTVTTAVVIQPFELVYVMVAVPIPFPVTNPAESIDAMAGLEEIHGFVVAGGAKLASVVVKPLQTLNVPVITGKEITVTITDALHPFVVVYVIAAVPAVFPVTTPVLLTVATVVFEETHAFTAAGAEILERFVVNP